MGNIGTYPPQNVSAQTPVLGYAEVTTAQNGIGTSFTPLTGLSVTVTIPAGRRIRISSQVIMQKITADGFGIVGIYEGPTLLNEDIKAITVGAGTSRYETFQPQAILTPSAGTHTYYLQARAENNTIQLESSANIPAFILVEDITGSQLPVLPQSIPVGLLGQAIVTANQPAITVWADIKGLSVNVSVPAGRTLKIRAEMYFENSAVNAAAGARMSLQQDGVQIQQVDHRLTTINVPEKFIGEAIVSPGAGSHTYKVVADNGGGGVVQLVAGPVYPAILTVEDITPTPAPGQGAPGSTLAYTDMPAQMGSVGTTFVDITGMAATVTVPEGRRLRISYQMIGINGAGVQNKSEIRIMEGTTIVGGFAEGGQFAAGAGVAESIFGSVIITPSSGVHTYKLQGKFATGASNIFYTDPANGQRSYLLIEDITGAVWPADAVPQHTVLGTTVLGYAEVNANQTGITTEVDLTGLSVTVNVPAGRRIKITGKVDFATTSGTGAQTELRIKEGATQLQRGKIEAPVATSESVQVSTIETPSVGTHTYKLAAFCGSGTVTAVAAADIPAFILVEDITGVADAYQPESIPVGVLAQAIGTTSVNNITTATQLLSVNVAVPAGRVLKITAGANVTLGGTTPRALGSVKLDGVAVGRWVDRTGATGEYRSASDSVLVSPSAGDHTIMMELQAITGNVNAEASATAPIHLFVEDVTPTPAPSQGAPGSTLAYTQVTTSQGSLGSTFVDLNNLSVTITVPEGRRIKIKGHAPFENASGTNTLAALMIREGGTTLQHDYQSILTGAGLNVSTFQPEVILTPSAGTHTYKLTSWFNNGSTNILPAAATQPAYILVEDVTGSVWPVGSTITAGMVASEAWNTWAPQLDNATLGNGTLTARWTRIGRLVTVSFFWIFGSSSDINSWFSISNFPVAAHAAAGGVGSVFMSDSSTGNRAVGVVVVSGTVGTIFSTIGGNGHVNNTYPWDWGTGDGLQFTVTYEAVS